MTANKCFTAIAVLGFLLGAAAGVARAQTAPETIEIKPGDTFSGIAARYLGDAKRWRSLYRPGLSGLPDPNRIPAGQTLELVTEASGARYLRLVGAAVTSAAAAPVTAPAAAPAPPAATARTPTPSAAPRTEPLVVGVLPNIPASLLNAQYEHVRRYLERQTGQPVSIVVPANFKQFYDATIKGEYDVAVAAPNIARVAQVDREMQPIGMYEPRIQALLVAAADSTITGPRDLRGKGVGFANPQSLLALYGRQWLRASGLEPGTDYEQKGARSDLGIGRMLLTGDVAAAIMSQGEFRALPQDESSRLKIIESFARIPNFIWLAHPRLDRDRVAQLRRALREMMTDRDDGAAFAQASGLTAVVDVPDATLRELDAFVAPTRQAMGPVR